MHVGLSDRFLPAIISRSYRKMGQPEEALEWAKVALTSKPMLSSVQSVGLQVYGNSSMAAALAQLGRVDEALSYYDTVSELVLNSGEEAWLSHMYHCRGLIERADGRFTDAILSFEMALEIVERLRIQGRINGCLLRLAETEIQLQIDESPDSDDILTFHWMNCLETMARKMNLPGILGQALLLKAKILKFQKKNNAAQDVLLQVREISKNPSTRFLQDRC